MTILELREKRAKAWEGAKAFLDSHRADKGVLSAEDDAAYSRMEQEIADLEQRLQESRQYAGQPKEQLEVEFAGQDTE